MSSTLNFGKAIILTWCSILIGFNSSAQAPNIQWTRFYGNSSGAFGVNMLQFPAPDGGYLVAGQVFADGGDVTGSGYHGGADIWLLKLRADGSIEWKKCLGGSGNDRLSNIGMPGGNIQFTTDGGIVLVGNSQSIDGDHLINQRDANHGSWDAWVVKLSNTGTIEWQRSLGGTADEVDFSIQQTPDDGYILGGATTSLDLGVANHGSRDIWVVKLNSTGSFIEWQRCLGGDDIEILGDIKVASDGGYIIASNTNSGDNGDVLGNHNSGFRDIWMVKLDSDGNVSWSKCFGGSDDDEAMSIEEVSDGYVIAGHTLSSDGDVSSNNGGFDYWVLKITKTEGNLIWENSLGGAGWELAFSLKKTTDGGFIISGTSESINDGDVTGGHGDWDGWIAKINSSGILQWQKSIGGADYDSIDDIQPTTDGGYIITGGTNSTDEDATDNPWAVNALWMVKLAPQILPVQLLYFTAQAADRQVHLTWSTAMEADNSHFTVQRSINGVHFQAIANVAGAGNSSTTKTYQLQDNRLPVDIHTLYYQLVQVDNNGKKTYSKTVRVQLNQEAERIRILGNPVQQDIILSYNSTLNEDIVVHLTDANGRTVSRQTYKVNRGYQTLSLSVTNHPSGTYFLEVINNQGRKLKVLSVIKQ